MYEFPLVQMLQGLAHLQAKANDHVGAQARLALVCLL